MNQFSAIIFDLDGVLVETEALHTEAKRIAFDRYRINVPADLYEQFKGRADKDIIEHVVREYAADFAAVSDVLACKHEVFLGLRDRIEPVAGALEFFRLARSHFDRIALTTSATVENQRFLCDRFGLQPFFDVIVTVDDVRHTKPDPEPYLNTLERLGLTPASCLVIEDSCPGILSAKAAGCTVAALTTSFDAETLKGAGPDYTVMNYTELANLLGLPVDVPTLPQAIT